MLAQVTTIPVRNRDAEKNKVSLATFVAQGLVGPKEMARAASDGYTVNIP